MLQRTFGMREIRCTYFGAEFLVDLRDGYRFDVATRRFEHGDLARLISTLRRMRPSVFVDVGANMGIYSCVVGSLDPGIRIVALEPDPVPFALLERQTAHSRLQSRATLIRAAAGASDGQEVSVTRGTGDKHLWNYVVHSGEGHCRAPLVTLDALNLPRGHCIAIKIDVDGYEPEVLRGAKNFFAQNYGYAQIEAFGENITAVTDWMAAAGWRMVERYGINSMFEKP
jgi:FkbM family methyltransferase